MDGLAAGPVAHARVFLLMIAIAAWFTGLWRLCTSPWIVLVAYGLLLAITLPLGAILHRELPPPSRPVTIEPGAGPVPDYDWLDEVTAHRRGLLGTLTPAVIGVAAPFDNLDRFASARAIPDFAIAVSGALLIAWAWLWGGVISRFAGVRRRFFSACGRLFIPVLTLNIAGVLAAIAVYVVARLILFDLIYPLLSNGAAENTAFTWRAILTVAMLAPLTLDHAGIRLRQDRHDCRRTDSGAGGDSRWRRHRAEAMPSRSSRSSPYRGYCWRDCSPVTAPSSSFPAALYRSSAASSWSVKPTSSLASYCGY